MANKENTTSIQTTTTKTKEEPNTTIINNKTEIVRTTTPSIFYEFKKGLGLEGYSDGSFILYFFLTVFVIQKANDLFNFIKNIIVLPKQVIDTYHYVTKEDLILLDKIDDLMNQLLGMLDADRIAIAKIHNGTYDNTNAHLMKFSMIYEVISERVTPQKLKVQNIPINYIKEEISLGSVDVFQRLDRTDLESRCDLYLDSVGLTTKYFKLLSVNKDIYGVIEIHFVNNPIRDFLIDRALSKRVYKNVKELEDCLQSILLKMNWMQKTVGRLFKLNNLFK
jgi:hypothetical protein